MRTHILFIALFSLFTTIITAQDQFARINNGNQTSAGTDTLSQSMVVDYGLVNLLDGISVVTGDDSIVLHPVVRGKAESVNGKIIFKEFTDVIILPHTQGIIVPGSIQKSGNRVVRFKVSFWKPDAQGARDDLFLTYVPEIAGKGNFIFEPIRGAKIKLGLYEYTVTDGSDAPLTLKVEKKTYDPNPAPGRTFAPPAKPKGK